MHPYLPHLLQDIANAHRVETPMYEAPKSFEEEMEEIERWAAGDLAEHSFGYFCGLKAEDFPPPEQLTDEEMRLVCTAIRQMMFTYNHDACFPETLPAAFDYRLLVDTLNEKTFIPSSGTVGFDHCTGHAPDCVFKEYCPCLEIWNSAESNSVDEPPLPDANEERPF